MIWKNADNKNNLRVIKTARDQQSINEAAAKGYWPLVKVLKANPLLQSKVKILQNPKSGIIEAIGDYRQVRWLREDETNLEPVTDWIYYYPHNFPNPFAAYLIPKDIIIDERVFVEDLIEDFIGASWNQGSNYRLPSCEAIWDGKDLVIQYEPNLHRRDFIG